MFTESILSRPYLTTCFLAVALLTIPSRVFADCENNFVSQEVAKAYLRENPYIIAYYSTIEGQQSYLFRVDTIYMEGEHLTVSGPALLTWDENSFGQRTYYLPDTEQVFTDELCGNYHFGYYKPMRAAFPLGILLGPAGGTKSYSSAFLAFPDPEVIPDVEKGYSLWLDQLPEALRKYCLWWYENASVGPPVLYDLIDSVLSVPEGGCKPPPELYTDYDHCPGEGCRYGEWKTSETINVFDRPRGTKRIGVISAGESFTAVAGNVYLNPEERVVGVPFEVYDSTGSVMLESGRKYYILSNIGEGQSKIWVNGRIMISSESQYNTTQEWWVEIITGKGKKGWILFPDSGCITGCDYLE